MLTPQMAAAYDELSKLGQSIAESEANIRVLDAIGSPSVIELRAKLATAKTRREQVMAAIKAEEQNA